MISRKFLRELARGSENSYAVGRRHGVKHFPGSNPYEDGVLHCEMQVIEEQGDKTLRQAASYGGIFVGAFVRMIGDGDHRNSMGCRRFQAKSGDGLRLAIIEKLEIFFFKIVDDLAILVAHDNAQ